jgi:hypothetical protein
MTDFVNVYQVMEDMMLTIRKAVKAVASRADAFLERLSSDQWLDFSHQCKPSPLGKLCVCDLWFVMILCMKTYCMIP